MPEKIGLQAILDVGQFFANAQKYIRATGIMGKESESAAGSIDQISDSSQTAGTWLDYVDREMDEAGDGAAELGKDAESSSKKVKGLGDTAKAVGAAITAFLTSKLVTTSLELAKLGAQSERTGTAFEAISGGADRARMNLDAMKTATRGALSEQELMASASQLMQMGLANNSAELGQLTEMAVTLGNAMGRDASESISSFSLLLANSSIPRLDTFGISAATVRERIAELQAETEGLDRQTAFMTATMEQGEIAMATLGEATEDNLLSMEQYEASLADAKAAVGTLLAPAVAKLADIFGDLADAVTENVELNEKLVDLYGEEAVAAAQAAQAQEFLFRSNLAVGRSTEETADTVTDLENRYRGLEATSMRYAAQAAAIADATQEAVEPTREMAHSVEELASAFASGIPDARDLLAMIVTTAAASGMSAEAVGSLAQSLGVADDMTVQAVLGMTSLQEGLDDGSASMQDAIAFGDALTEANRLLAESEEAAADGNEALAQSLRDQAQAQIDNLTRLGETGMALGEVEETSRGAAEGIDEATRALEEIPEETVINIDESDVMSTNQGLQDIQRRLRDINETAVAARVQVGAGTQQMQHGGHLGAGQAAIVGEAGAELFISDTPGTILPHEVSRAMADLFGTAGIGGGGSGARTVNEVSSQVDVSLIGDVDQMMATAIRSVVRDAVNEAMTDAMTVLS